VHETNQTIAARFREAAALLQAQKAGPARIRVLRRAAAAIEAMEDSAASLIAREGFDSLAKRPEFGEVLAAAVSEMTRGEHWPLLERLRGEHDPESLFRTVDGIGPDLAKRIHDALHVDTLEALEEAAHDGRLASVKGIGPRRAETIRKALALRHGGARAFRRRRAEPPVDALLETDSLYRKQAAAGALPTIAPRRFNAERHAWLPILHARRGDWHFTALYSNAARAHEAGVGDWVAVYFYDSEGREGQRTIATENGKSPLAGRRVVRGRESECLGYYATRKNSPPFQGGA
jgi:DNA polymerase (family X)